MSKKILIGIIIPLLLSNCYFYWQNQSIINELKKIDTNENEYQFSIFQIDDMEYHYYHECEDNYDVCDECIEKQNECAEKYNKCADDYRCLVRQIDAILEKK